MATEVEHAFRDGCWGRKVMCSVSFSYMEYEYCPIPNSAQEIKQSRKTSLLEGFQPASRESQSHGSNEFLDAHRLRDIYEINAEIIGLF